MTIKMKTQISIPSVVLRVCIILVIGCIQTKVEPASLPTKLSKRHADLLSKLSHYELVRPYRSSHEGDFVTHDLSTEIEEDLHDFHTSKEESSRRKRDTKYSTRKAREADLPEQPHFNFAVDAFGDTLTLDVTRSRHLVSPTFKVTMNMGNGEKIMYRPRTNCFYTGHVKNSMSSTVAISNCDGMSGLIRVEDEEYIIEPLETPSETTSNVTEGHVHIMYRRKDWAGDNGYFDTSLNSTHPRLYDDEMYPDPNYPPPVPETPSSSRQRRQSNSQYEREHHIETLITADFAVWDFHGENYVITYLMTMMHVVNVAYAHPSLEATMDLTVINIILLSENQSENMVVENNAPSSLTNVCQWAYSQSSPDESHPDHYDHAVFLTRENFGPAGYAPVTGMCSMRRSCSLNKDEGILSAFVVAHECGHVLGMEHDGQGQNDCQEDALTGSVMAPVVIAVYNKFFWSECSKNELHNYLWRYSCLWDDPFDNGYAAIDQHPGERYSMDEQCRFDFGDGWRVCRQGNKEEEIDHEQWSSLFSFSRMGFDSDFDTGQESLSDAGSPSIPDYGSYLMTSVEFGEYNPCEQLWCVDIHDPYYCKTKKGPPLDGTTCGSGRWCMSGECVYTDTERQDGQWSDWSPWTQCSYNCGVGAVTRTRDCNNPPPQNGGHPCKGGRLEYKLCNIQDCKTRVDRRAGQCQQHLSNWDFRGRRHTWLPHENRNKTLACKLTCISQETKDVVMTEYNVYDGTPCSYDNHESVCIQGNCVNIGCNRKLDEPLQGDICGVCLGDHTNCDLVKGRFEEKPRENKYQIVVDIPAGARNIEIRDTNGAKHFLALRRTGTKDYILNKKKQQSKSHDFIFVGARFVYVNEDDQELLACKGPIEKRVSVALCWTDDTKPANVTYQYHMNLIEDHNMYDNTVPTIPAPKNPTVVGRPIPPGGGATVATEPNAIPVVDVDVEPELIDPELIIPDVGTNPQYVWESTGWTECTKTCDSGKKFYRYQCRMRDTSKKVKFKKCGQTNYNSKGLSRLCNTQPCHPSPSSPESESHSTTSSSENNDINDSTPTKDTNPDTDEPTSNAPNDRITTNPSKNTSPKGPGTTQPKGPGTTQPKGPGTTHPTQREHTSSNNNIIVDTDAPNTVESDNNLLTTPPKPKPKPGVQFLWEATPWGPCSRTCGTQGLQTRTVRCLKVRASGNSSTNGKNCKKAGGNPKPSLIQPCNQDPCKAFWSVGSWSECSVTCGPGVESRDVLCPIPDDQAQDFACTDDKPLASRLCEKPECPSNECIPQKSHKICKKKKWERYCELPGYSDLCCTTCDEMREIMNGRGKREINDIDDILDLLL